MFGPRGFKLQQLDIIRDPECHLCNLYKSAINICVMGRGTVLAPIHLIGEAPGEAETLTGKPFMGKAGQLLNEILKNLEMYYMVYISNTVRCRPPENRKPKNPEVKICASKFLEQELKVINAKVLVLMGRTAIDYFIQTPFVRGQVYQSDSCKVIPTWHPSYLNRTRPYGTRTVWSTRIEFEQHLRTAKNLV